MPRVIILPHEDLCPEGECFEIDPGISICDALLKNNIEIEHACEKCCACTTCHVWVREGINSLNPPSEIEDDLLDRAWGTDMDSRLSCQAMISDKNIIVEIPRYTINHAKENKD
ncbi:MULTISPECIES: ISC system 2Fe-2S type ferredoxin [Candidatus Ichthyocystis]|uniref:2Fe-2S ferredoxin n=1 Tax=Candidatus Ichthyocystis hellenicum TaxID=1561003 RepID=A0A0S4M3N6_9BURK|nr:MULTISPECIES: ISC system 2Fe-2S type ferredoxin [Ichthyocystis]CUT17615.1 2Fe-2S ferredoxin [Candidatus Ichthyocystis hellenicum]